MPLSNPPYAVIDIGSNSVRMVVYHALSRVPMPLFNEKYYCGLARDLEQTGALHPEGITLAHQALGRFVLMLERFNIDRALVIATAAIRDASDGAAFVQSLKKDYGMNVTVIDGEREAELAAKGVLSSVWKPDGLVADLGGGSLELAHLKEGRIKKRQSLPIGTLRLLQYHDSPKKLRAAIREALATVTWLGQSPMVSCFAIGGSFRSIAKMHSRQSDYPLKLIHEYRLKEGTIHRMARDLSQMNDDSVAALPGIPSKRAPTITLAAILLDELLQQTGCRHVLFSVTGIREGVVYDQLSEDVQQQDPLLASAEELAALSGRTGQYAHELFDWMQPLFKNESWKRARMRHALCILSEIAWNIDPNFRSEWAYLRILQSDMKGLSHRERVTLAMALHHRHQLKWKKDVPESSLIDESDKLWAQCAGLATNLAFQLSGGQHGNLHHATLKVKDGTLKINVDDDARPLLTDVVDKRLSALQQSFDFLIKR